MCKVGSGASAFDGRPTKFEIDRPVISERKIEQVVDRYDAIQSQMSGDVGSEQFVALSKEYSELQPIVEAIQAWRAAKSEINDLTQILDDADSDADMRELASAELDELKERVPELEQHVQLLFLPKDAADERNCILEVRAGTGGDEAALFAGDLFRMYQRYAEDHSWKMEVISASESDLGGFKEITASISGKGVFARLKFESGVHRVQRVPETEAGGRIHTSAATVAILPEPEDVDVKIDEKDLRIDVFRASGPGGQSVNTTDSAVRITHLPTGLVVSQQDEKSQHKNKAKALKVLRARLFELERAKVDAERAQDRKGQVGSGDRSERIRTYNFPQGRVTDHRINLTLYRLDKVISGEELDDVIEPLIAEHQARLLTESEAAA